jgi:hypothetical protein
MRHSTLVVAGLSGLLVTLSAAPAIAQSAAPWRDPSPHQVRFVLPQDHE